MKINSDFYSINTTFLYFLLFFLSLFCLFLWVRVHVDGGQDTCSAVCPSTVLLSGANTAPSWAGRSCSSFINTINKACLHKYGLTCISTRKCNLFFPQLFNCNTLEKCFPVFPHTHLGEQLHFHTRSSISHLNLGLLKAQVWGSRWSIALTTSLRQSFKVRF